jgi:mono/diheme cytochrome c family protein
MRIQVVVLAVFFFSSSLISCGHDEDEDEVGSSAVVPVEECASALKWTGGNAESPLMHPGGDCIACHAKEGDGPNYEVAGTVYQALAESTDCYGLEGITVELTDAEGTVHTMTTNASGNFFAKSGKSSIVMPYTARLVMGDKEAKMVTPQSIANCAECHTAKGAAGASGRIVWPH